MSELSSEQIIAMQSGKIAKAICYITRGECFLIVQPTDVKIMAKSQKKADMAKALLSLFAKNDKHDLKAINKAFKHWKWNIKIISIADGVVKGGGEDNFAFHTFMWLGDHIPDGYYRKVFYEKSKPNLDEPNTI
jgi:hypothetical protein